MWFDHLRSKFRKRSSSEERITSNDEDNAASPDTPKKSERPGLYLLYDGLLVGDQTETQSYEVDIVAIHGFTGTCYGTWTHEDKTLWLRDVLPRDFPKARIFTYSYPSQFLCRSKATVADYARSLLSNLISERRGQERRPIVFLAHSLGGIVCKQALIKASQEKRFTVLLESTIGIFFFGTPHRGAKTDTAAFLSDLYRIVGGAARSDHLRLLKANSPNLMEIAEAFSPLCGRFQIVTVFETEVHWLLKRLVRETPSAPFDSMQQNYKGLTDLL